MNNRILPRLTAALWAAIVLSIVLMALYVSFGRYFTSLVSQYQDDILQQINARLQFEIEVEHMQGQWRGFQPSVELRGLQLLTDSHIPVPVRMETLSVGLDVFSSLYHFSPRFNLLNATAGHLQLQLSPSGELSIPGIPAGPGASGAKWFRLVFNTLRLKIDNLRITLHEPEVSRDIYVSADLSREGEFRRFTMSLLSPSQQSWFRVIAEGNGDPTDFADFQGDFHLQFAVSEVELYRDLGRAVGMDWHGGKVESELWLSIDHGAVVAAADLSAANLALSSLQEPEREISLEQFSVTLRALREASGWRFGAADLLLAEGEERIELDHLSGSLAAGRFSALLRDIDIARFVRLLVAENLAPAGVDEVLEDLAPTGKMQLLKLEVENLEQSFQSWRLSGNFTDLSVMPWRGAPGVDNANGYLSIGPGDGLVQLDSSGFSMSFPSLYKHPLAYEEFAAQLQWTVDEYSFDLRSGPFTAQGAEGEVRGLFSLLIPLQPTQTGLEMDLMVGLRDSATTHRGKYLPYILSPNLLNWLEGSISEGHIRNGAFLYRGSLGAELAQYRNMQLYFDVEDATLDYHPDWPSISDVRGVVIIDEADVDVVVDSGTLRDSSLRRARVTLRTSAEEHLMLSVKGLLDGSAADGLWVLNNSPLRALVGDVFVDWELQGGLLAELDLLLDLTDADVAPQVLVGTRWDAVTLDTGSLRLTVDDVNGKFWFDTFTGFRADSLGGTLWGNPLQARLTQEGGAQGLGELDIGITGSVDAAALRNWLNLDVLRLADGSTDVDLHIKVPPAGAESGALTRLEINSSLEGVTLDLPEPYGKSAEDARGLSVVMPLVGETRRLLLNLDDEAFLAVQMGSDGYEGASLGFGFPPPQQQVEGLFTISGELERVDWSQWQEFVETYVLAADDSSGFASVVSARDVKIGVLTALGQELRNLDVDALQLEDSWKVVLEMPWASGTVNVASDLSHLDIHADRIDLDAMNPALKASLEGEGVSTSSSLPVIDAAISQLLSGGGSWGDLSFHMEQKGQDFEFTQVRGELRGIRLGGAQDGLTLRWLRGDTARTELVGELGFTDFGEVLAEYGYDRVVETSTGSIQLDMSWGGSPADFSLATSSGRMDVQVEKGRFLKTSGATSGTLRVVSILNLADFVRRLSLDLSYVFESGVPFDTIDGHVLMKERTLDVPRLDVRGRSSRFQFSGTADLEEQVVDGKLVATLPVASNLPWMAALISGLPAAAAVYVASKLFTKQMDRFSSAVYRIDGSWDDPQVNFERIFDNTQKQQAVTIAPDVSSESGNGDEDSTEDGDGQE